MIQAVIFDLWGVLATKKNWLFDEIAKDLGISKDSHPYFIELLTEMEIGKLEEEEFWRLFCERYNIDLSKHRIRPWVSYYKRITNLNLPLINFARQLKQEKYKTAILSNTDRAAADYINKLGLISDFDTTVFSFEVGVAKPNKKIYEMVLSQLAVNPKESIFIDDQEKWVEAASNLGIHGIVYRDMDSLMREIEAIL